MLVPESGDGIQAMKAGLMEIGDLFVINKADREGAERAAYAINTALELRTGATDWAPPVLLTVASQGTGVEELVDRFEEHLVHLQGRAGLELRRRKRLEQHLEDLLRANRWKGFRDRIGAERWRSGLDRLVRREWTPHQAAMELAKAAREYSPAVYVERVVALYGAMRAAQAAG